MQRGVGLFNGLVTMVMIVVLLVWGVTSLTNEDPLWFIHRFTAQAESITIHWDGSTYTLKPGEPNYDALMNAFAKAIADPRGFEWEVGFSSQNIEDYRSQFKLAEFYFAEPVQVHTRHPYPEAATYLVPLDKTHALWQRVFAFTGNTDYSSGPLNMKEDNFAALYIAAEKAVLVRD